MTTGIEAKCTLPFRAAGSALAALERIPYSLVALLPRAALAHIYWNAGYTKILNWDGTLFLFSAVYNVPLLPPALAAYLATALELTTPWLLLTGFFSRVSALLLLGETLVIEIFVFPKAWPDHLIWAAMLVPLVVYGPGRLSLDHLVRRRLGPA